MHLKFGIVAVSLIAAALNASCAKNAPEKAPAVDSAAAPTAATKPTVSKSAVSVAKIAFVDQVEACDCTKKRIDETWKALQEALTKTPGVSVERIHLDTEQAQADKYNEMEALVVPPGIYLLDENDAFVKLLQGEVTVAQILAAMGG